MDYAELHAHSCYSFLDGASQPDEMALRAAELGYETLALTDHDSLSGSLEFAHAAHSAGLRPITGCELTLEDGSHLTLLVETQAGYGNLCRLLSQAHSADRRAPAATLDQLSRHAEGLHCLSGCAREGMVARLTGQERLAEAEQAARVLRAIFGCDRFAIELQRPYRRGDARRNRLLTELAARLRLRVVATGDPHAHTARRAYLQDALVAIRLNTTLDACEHPRRGNHEAVLHAPAEMATRFAPRRCGARPKWLTDAASTSPRILATAIPTSSPRPASLPPRRCNGSAGTNWSGDTPAAPICTRPECGWSRSWG